VLTIGEFSRTVRLSVKTLRFYQEEGILMPVRVDDATGYRFYDENSYERAEAILTLKEMGFSLKEIRTIFRDCAAEEDLRSFIDAKLRDIRARKEELARLERRLASYERLIDSESPAYSWDIGEIELTIPHFLSLPIRGSYDLISDAFRKLYRKAGRYSQGKPFCFFHDREYREEDASLEVVLETEREQTVPGLKTGKMEGLKAVKAVYTGPYGGQGSVYLKLFGYCSSRGYIPAEPIIEHYVKGPGLVFRGNPQNYLTECIIPVRTGST